MTVRNSVAWQDEGSKQGVTEEGMAQGGGPGRTATSAGNSVELLTALASGPHFIELHNKQTAQGSTVTHLCSMSRRL
jgi:hypothetical protein